MLTPLPPNKRKPKFHVRTDDQHLAEESGEEVEHDGAENGTSNSGSNPPNGRS
jgi:hypothetical protein